MQNTDVGCCRIVASETPSLCLSCVVSIPLSCSHIEEPHSIPELSVGGKVQSGAVLLVLNELIDLELHFCCSLTKL